MDENKAAASAEVAALATSLKTKLAHARARNSRNRIEMAKDLTKATKAVYEKMANVQKAQMAASNALSAATSAAATATSNSLKRAKKMFATKIGMLTNVVAANAKRAHRDITALTGVVHNIAKAAAADRKLIKDQTKAMEADLNKAVTRAIQIGEAKAKAVEQRIAAHLKTSKRFLQVELSNRCEDAADKVFKIINGKRQKIADNYLSFKAYAVSAMDKVTDYTAKGKGRNLSSIGDLMMTVGALAAVKAPKAEGLGFGGKILPPVFSGKNVKVKGAVAKINGLVNEYATSAAQVRARWPMGLGKYLLDRFEVSMEGKGVLQVDKVSGKAGNFVYVNGRSVGLSNKLNDFASLASRMSVYEAVLAKLTSRLTVGPKTAHKISVKPPEWQGKL
jgi:leucyl-tRNA synthetase